MPDIKKLPETVNGSTPSKKRKTRNENRSAGGSFSINDYYIDISRRYKMAKYLTVFLLITFILGMMTANRDDITVEGFQYLMRYINLDSNVNSYASDYKKIAYSADTEINFEMFRGDFVISDSTAINIYSLSGLNVLSESSYISNPVIKTSDRHLLIYDLGGNSYALYNTFSKLFGETLPYPITGAANSDNGLYALVTKTQEYRSAVYIYDRNFGLISRILKDKLVMDVSIKSDGSSILIVSVFNRDGDFNTEIMTCNPYSDSAAILINLDDTMALRSHYSENGFTVLCDSKLLFYTNEGILKSEYSYKGEIPVYSLITDNYTFIAFSENVVGDAHRLLIFDSNGIQITEKKIDGQIIKLQCLENYFFALTSNSIIKMEINGISSAIYPIEKNSIDLIATDKNTLFLCYPSYAISVDILSAFPDTPQLTLQAE